LNPFLPKAVFQTKTAKTLQSSKYHLGWVVQTWQHLNTIAIEISSYFIWCDFLIIDLQESEQIFR
jgi:hypothetical protein